ncbi:MAG: hypothetical protein V4633_06975 [Pseudomonadota bacterium]
MDTIRDNFTTNNNTFGLAAILTKRNFPRAILYAISPEAYDGILQNPRKESP